MYYFTKLNNRSIVTVALSQTGRVFLALLFAAAALAGNLSGTGSSQGTPTPTPTAGVNISPEIMLGETFTFTVTFDNTDPTYEGYGPYLDVFMPASGIDGDDGTNTPGMDGIIASDATYLGVSLQRDVQDCQAGLTVIHPLTGLIVTCPAAPANYTGIEPYVWQLNTITLPFGSFVPEQPILEVTMTGSLSSYADVGTLALTGLPIHAVGGFMFGYDPLDNPAIDPPIIGATASATTRPTLITLTKTYIGPEDETATGPNYPRRYRITADIAENQVFNDFHLFDYLPDTLQYLQVIAGSCIPGGCDYTLPAPGEEPLTGAPRVAPDNNLDSYWTSVTGGSGTSDAEIVFEFFVPLNDAAGNPILPADTGNDNYSINDAAAQGDWTPEDPRDGPQTVISDITNNDHTLEDQSDAIQKSVRNWQDNAAPGYSPQDILEYTLDFQISDYFAFDNIVITDTFSDGQRFDDSWTPTLEINGNTYNLSVSTFNNANFDVDPHYSPYDTTGDTIVTFYVSDEIALRRGIGFDGYMVGGCIDYAAGGSLPDCGAYNNGATTGVIRFHTIIQQAFTDDYPPGTTPSVDQGDILTDSVIINGDVLDTQTLTPTGNTEDDDSGAGIEILRGQLIKTVYAVNGDTTIVNPMEIAPGDVVTYRLQYNLPTADVENMSFLDYLPLPIYDATEVTTVDYVSPAGTIPPAGSVTRGPNDTFYSYSGITPTVSSNSQENSIEIYYGDYTDSRDLDQTVDILFSVTVLSEPFADRLFLTNQARAYEASTNNGDQVADAIVQVILTEPVVSITKGVVYTDNTSGSALFSPPTVGPVVFNAGGCPRFVPTINSAGLAAHPINSNLSGVDAGDLVTYAIVLENTGTGLTGAHDIQIRDTLPAGTTLVPGSVCVTDGTGAAMSYSDIAIDPLVDDGLFGEGIELIDPGPTAPPGGPAGALDPYDDTDGRNIAIVTYNVIMDNTVQPGDTFTNTATLFNYAGIEGGEDHTGTDLTDDAVVEVRDPLIEKVLTTTEFTTAPNDLTEAVIGETITYTLTLTVPEGQTSGLQVLDQLDLGLAFIQCDSITASPALSTSLGVDFSSACTTPTVQDNGQRITYSLGDVTNSDTNNANAETIQIVYRVVVLNTNANQNTTPPLNNSATLSWTTGSLAPVSAAVVSIIEPDLDVAKSVDHATADAGDPITYTLVIRHTAASQADAYDITFNDPLPTLADGSSFLILNLADPNTLIVTDTAGLVHESDFEIGGDVSTGYFLRTPAGTSFDYPYSAMDTITISVSGDIAIGAIPGHTYTNNSTVYWHSLDGDFSAPRSSYNTSSVERTGAGGINNYNNPGSIGVQIYNPALTKTIRVTSESFTSNPGGFERLAIGEIARYRLVATIPEGTSPNLTITDILPPGLLFLDDDTARVAFISTSGTGITSTTITDAAAFVAGDETTYTTIIPAGTIPGAQINPATFTEGVDPIFTLGTVVNSDDDDSTEYIILEFNALVMNVVGNQAYVQSSGSTSVTNLLNSFNLQIDTSTFNSNTLTATVAEPLIRVPTKAWFGTAPSDAGDPFTYRISFTNSSASPNGTPAYEVRVTDTVNAFLTVNSITVTDGADVPIAYTGGMTGNVLDITIAQLNVGASVRVNIIGVLNSNIPARYTLNNTANITYTSLPGSGTSGNPTGSNTPGASGANNGERNGTSTNPPNDYLASATLSRNLNAPTIDKLAVSPTEYTIGEEITYNIRVVLPEGDTRQLVVTDTFQAGLTYVSWTPITTAAASGGLLTADYGGTLNSPTVTVPGGASGGNLVLNFGNQLTTDDNNVNNNAFLIRVVARVNNEIANQDGQTRTNSAQLTYNDGVTGRTVTDPNGAPVITIREPVLRVQKSVSTPPVPADAGSTVTYTVVISHDPTSNRNAFDAVYIDTLPASLTNPVVISVTESGGAVIASEVDGPNNRICIPGCSSGTFDLLMGHTVTIVYTADLTISVGPSDTITNTGHVTWTSLDGTVSGERTSGDGLVSQNVLNNYENVGSANFQIDNPLFSKSLEVTSESYTTGSNVAIGELVTYGLVVTLPEGTSNSVSINDALPTGLVYISHALVTTAASSDGLLAANFNGTVAIQSATTPPVGTNGTVTVNFGTVVTNADNVTDNNAFLLQITARVANIASNQRTVNRDNSATLSYQVAGQPNPTTITRGPVRITIVEPELNINKVISDPPVPPDAGGHVEYTIVIDHRVTSGYLAPDVVFSDTIPTGLVNIHNVVITPVNVAMPSHEVTGVNNTTIRVPSTADGSIDLPLDASITITFVADINNTLPVGDAVTNTGSVIWTSLDGPYANTIERTSGDGLLDAGGLNDYEVHSSASFDTFGLNITKAVHATSAVHTPDGSVTIGEVITYDLNISLPEGVIPSTVVTDYLPVGLIYVPGSAVLVPGTFNGTFSGYSVMSGGVSGGDIIINFYEIDLPGDNILANNTFTIRFQALVLDEAGNDGLPPGQTTLTNYADVIVGNQSDQSNNVDQVVVEPELTIAKDFDVYTVGENDPVTVTLAVTNTGTTAAFDVEISDPIAATEYTNVTEGTTPAGFTFNYAAGVVSYSGGPIPAGETRTFTFTANVINMPEGTSRTNTATITEYSTLPGVDANERTSGPVADDDDLLGVAPDMRIIKDDGLATVIPGQVVVYTLTVDNHGTRRTDGVTIYETVPSNATFVAGSSDPLWSCTGTAPGSTCTLVFPGEFAVNETRVVTFAVRVQNPVPEGSLQLSNTATVAEVGTHGIDPLADNTDDDVDDINASPNLVVVKSYTQATDPNSNGLIEPGERIQYQLVITNNGDQDAGSVVLTDDIDPNTVFISASSTQGTVVNSGVPGSESITATIGTIAGLGGSVTITVVVEVINPLPAGIDEAENQGDVTGSNFPPTPSNPVYPPLVAAPDMVIEKTDADVTAIPGGGILYTLTIRNVGNQDATGVVITETIPDNTTFVAAQSEPGWICPNVNPGTICTLDIGNFGAGDPDVAVMFAVSVAGSIPAGVDEISNTARVDDDGTNGPDPTPDNNEDTEPTPLDAAPDLEVFKDDGVATTTPGSTLTYQVDYQNNGPQGATGVYLLETLPANTTFNAALSDACWFVSGANYRCNIGALPVGNSGSVNFVVDVITPIASGVDEIYNIVTIADDGLNGAETDMTNNTSEDTDTLDAAPDMTIVKDDGVTLVSPGTTLTYQIIVNNAGDQDATGVVVIDEIPDGTTYVSSTGGGVYDNTTREVTWTIGDVAVNDPDITLNVTVTIDDPLDPAVTEIYNHATVEDDGTNGPDPTPRDNETEDTDQLGEMVKRLDDTENNPDTLGTNVAIGETLVYEVSMIIPNGTTAPDLVLTDILDQGLAFLSCEVIPNPGLIEDPVYPFNTICGSVQVGPYPTSSTSEVDRGRHVIWTFGTVSNNSGADVTLTVRYRVVVLNNPQNVRSEQRVNAATFTWASGTLSAGAQAVTLVEPTLIITKDVDRTVVFNGDIVTYTLTLDHDVISDSDAYNVELVEPLPLRLTYIPGSLHIVSGQPPTQTIINATNIILRWDSFTMAGGLTTIEFQARVTNLNAGTSVTNTANVTWSSMPGNYTAPQTINNLFSTERVYDPNRTGNTYGASAAARIQAPSLPETGFAPQRVTIIPVQPDTYQYQNISGMRIEIPSLEVNSIVEGVPFGGTSGWDLTWLGSDAGWLTGTAYPGWEGNSAITGHVYLPNGQPGPFVNLHTLVWGDQVILHANGQRYVYEVRQVLRTWAGDLSPLAHEDHAWLTLLTCQGFNEDTNAYIWRIAVRAVLVQVTPETTSAPGN